MPNWCNNHAVITHEDPAKIQEIVDLIKDEDSKWFQTVMPYPNGEWDYDWCVANWGTKWEPQIYDHRIEDDALFIDFDTAWGPAPGIYDAMHQLGYGIDVYYYEGGMSFCGHYENGVDDYYEIGDLKANQIRDVIGEELDDMYGISEQAEQWEKEQKDDLQIWIEEGAEKNGAERV